MPDALADSAEEYRKAKSPNAKISKVFQLGFLVFLLPLAFPNMLLPLAGPTPQA